MNLAMLSSNAVSSGKRDSRGSALHSATALSPLEKHTCHHGWRRVLWTAREHRRGVTGETRGVMSDCSCIMPCRGCTCVAFPTGWLGFWKAWRIQWQGYIDEVGGSCARQEHRCRGGPEHVGVWHVQPCEEERGEAAWAACRLVGGRRASALASHQQTPCVNMLVFTIRLFQAQKWDFVDGVSSDIFSCGIGL